MHRGLAPARLHRIKRFRFGIVLAVTDADSRMPAITVEQTQVISMYRSTSSDRLIEVQVFSPRQCGPRLRVDSWNGLQGCAGGQPAVSRCAITPKNGLVSWKRPRSLVRGGHRHRSCCLLYNRPGASFRQEAIAISRIFSASLLTNPVAGTRAGGVDRHRPPQKRRRHTSAQFPLQTATAHPRQPP